MAKKETKKEIQNRSPVVVVLGHVDHGKSSLLEAIRNFKITEKESGGITQHIGAYVVDHNNKSITFIDTPGHEAFFAMRSRGTRAADIGILVVAADESIKEQTKEAVRHLKESKMPFIVAINKIDKKNIDIEKVKQDLSKIDVFVESYGGNVPSVNISAKTKKGIDDLLEIILLLAEMEDIKEEGKSHAEGIVIEVQRDAKRGVVATFLVKKGTLKKGDNIATQSSYGRARCMENFLGEEVEEAPTSTPVQIIGIRGCPEAGEDFFVFRSIEEAKKFNIKDIIAEDVVSHGEGKVFHIILKADVAGSLEAIKGAIEKIPQDKIKIKIIKSGIGDINDSDIDCIKTAEAKIFGFKVKIDRGAEKIAIRDDIEIKLFDVIYELIDTVKEEAEGRLDEVVIKEETGSVKVLAVFKTQKDRQILGGKVLEGEVKKTDLVDISRGEQVIGGGKLINMKKEEKDIVKIKRGEEFGMLLESKEKVEEGDILSFYNKKKEKQKL